MSSPSAEGEGRHVIAIQSKGAVRRTNARTSQQLNLLADRLVPAASLVRNTYRVGRGFADSVEVVVPLTNDTLEVVDTTSEGAVRVWVTGTDDTAWLVLDAALGTGFLAAALATRLVATLGLPNEAGSNAAA